MSTKTYTLGKHKQLIDLNGDLTNFEITVTVTAKDPKSVFDIVVIDEASLNNTQNIEYKQATGTISSTIVNDNNMYKNYYVVMKADTPCQVDLTIEKQEIAPKPIQAIAPPTTVSSPPHPLRKNLQLDSQINWPMILVIGGLVAVGLYFFVFSGKKAASNGSSFNKPAITTVSAMIQQPAVHQPITHQIPASMPNIQASVCNNPSSLFNKLSKLPVDD